jgi:GlcNAc-P-P-Und epimerase
VAKSPAYRGCLVTGSEGFVGRALVAALRESELFEKVVALDKLPSATEPSIAADIRKPVVETSEVLRDIDVCVHLAALAKEPGFDHADYYEVNHGGTRNVLSLCDKLGVKTMVFTSTMMVFPAGEKRYSEGDQVAPDTAYGGSKALAERDVLSWSLGDLSKRSIVLRPGVVFGPGDVGNFERMRRALEMRRFAFIGRRDTVKSCIHIDDLVGFILHAITFPELTGTYHIAFPVATRIDEIVRATQQAFGLRGKVHRVPLSVAMFLGRIISFVPQARALGVHPRRFEKLNYSTDILADRWLSAGYAMRHPTLPQACRAWKEGSVG